MMNEGLDIRKLRKSSQDGLTTVVSNRDESGAFWRFLQKDISFSKRITDRTKEAFYLELFSLLGAGIDISTALELAIEGQRKSRVRSIFQAIKKQVIEGNSLSVALQASGEFTSYEYFSIRIGEETGKLLPVLKDLSTFFAKKITQRRQIISAVSYPAIVLSIAVMAVGFMITFVIPMFADTFRRFNNDLPRITKTVISMAAFMKGFILYFVLLIAAFIGYCYSQSKKTWFRKYSSTLMLKIPVIGKVIHKIHLARFSNAMALLIGARIPLTKAIELIKEMITFYPIESSLNSISDSVLSGKSLHESLAANSIYPSKMISLVKVGEEVNQLELFFARLFNQYSSEVEYQTLILGKFLEPLIIILLGLIVGTILIAMYLPMFQLGQSF